nr:MAG TPA: hypothetical protein [Bacteriophage sp.]
MQVSVLPPLQSIYKILNNSVLLKNYLIMTTPLNIQTRLF